MSISTTYRKLGTLKTQESKAIINFYNLNKKEKNTEVLPMIYLQENKKKKKNGACFFMSTFMKISSAKKRVFNWLLLILLFLDHSWKLRLTWGLCCQMKALDPPKEMLSLFKHNNKNRIPDNINFLTRTKQNDIIIITLNEMTKIPTLFHHTSSQRCNCMRAHCPFH